MKKKLLLISIIVIFFHLVLSAVITLSFSIYFLLLNCITAWQLANWAYKLYKYLIEKFNL